MAVSEELRDSWLDKAIKAEVERRVASLMAERVLDAQATVAAVMRESIGQIVLSVLSNYDVVRNGNDIMIRVRQGVPRHG